MRFSREANANCWRDDYQRQPLAASFVDAVNTFYGRGSIPIGVCCRSGITKDDGKFNSVAKIQDDGRDRFPHDLKDVSMQSKRSLFCERF